MDPFDRAEEDIEQRVEDGLISPQQATAEHKVLRDGYHAEAEQAAQEAYDAEMERW